MAKAPSQPKPSATNPPPQQKPPQTPQESPQTPLATQTPQTTTMSPQHPETSQESPNEESGGASSPPNTLDGTHLDAIGVEEPDGSGGQAQADTVAPTTQVTTTTGATVTAVPREVFRGTLKGVFNGASTFSGMQSLAVQEPEVPRADLCADALYDTACEVHWLNFLVQPSNPWMARTVAIGSFLVPKVMMANAELKIKAAQAKGQGKAPANDNQATPADGLAGFPDAKEEKLT